METQFEELVRAVRAYNDKPENLALIEKAWEFAKLAHADKKRDTGDPFTIHPLTVAMYLAHWKMDITSIIAGLLHDTISWGGAKREDIELEFGSEVTDLVEGVSRVEVPRKGTPQDDFYSENMRKMILAMAKDLRIVIIRMASRLHNMETQYAVPEERRIRNAKETLEIFAPLAERLGIGELKTKFEDLGFQYLYPEEYARIVEESKPYYKKAEMHIKKMKQSLLKHLVKENVGAKVLARKKHLYSLWKKLKRPENESDFSKINDIVALRIIVPDVKDCYIALGVLHNLYKPVPSLPIRDFVAQPKPNGYRSIHTNVFGPDGRITEVQIRTFEMHEQAEHGVAAHWAYSEAKAKGASDTVLEKGHVSVSSEKLSWVKQLVAWNEEISDSQEFLNAVKFDALADRIFAFTPKGDVYDLPRGATPIDLAYALHTDMGKYIRGATVNGKMVPLSKKLKNGDVVEILKLKNPVEPKKDWLGFAATTTARRQIQKHLRKHE
jgi:GTP diphosphokinase / guanosine-3',5'-bis(diphosphate) 3'-diphosphatase